MNEVANQFFEFFARMQKYIIEILPHLTLAIVTCLVLYVFFWLIKKPLNNRLNKSLKDPLLSSFYNRVLSLFKWAFLLVVFLTVLGKTAIITSILGAAGISAFIIGFAFKDIGENFLAGIMLAFQRPFRLGDTISTNGIEGVIKGLDLRETHVKTFDGKDVYIPNGQLLKNPLFNYTIDGFIRHQIVFHIADDGPLEKAREIVLQVANGMDDVLKQDKTAQAYLEAIDAPKVKLVLYYWIDTFSRRLSGGEIKSRIIAQSIQEFRKASIELPSQSFELNQSGEDK